MTAQPRPPYGSRHRRADHPRGPRTGPARPAGRHGGGHHRALQGAGGIAHARPLPFDDAPTVVLDRIPAGWFDAPTKPIPVVVPRPRGPVGNLPRPEPSTPDPARTTTAPATPYGEASGRRAPGWVTALLLPFLGLAVAALAVRAIGLTTGFELWVDEMVYAELGASVARGELPNLPDGPFFLHPPGFFVIEGLVIRIFGLGGSDVDLVYALRWVSAVAGSLTVGVVFLLVRRSSGRVAAVAAAAVLVFEPFVLRNNSRVFLETTAVLPVLVGLLLAGVGMEIDEVGAPRRRLLTLAAAGVAMGAGILTKDFMAIAAAGPVAVAAFWRTTLPRRDAGVLLCAMVLPYFLYLCVLCALGRFGDWWTAKSLGVQRMLGFVQSTGFNAPNAPSLLGRIVDQMTQFGSSYALLLTCPVAGVLLARSARADCRLLGLVAVLLGVFGIYTAAFGTFEEQYGYPVVIGGVLAAAVYGAELCERRPRMRPAIGAVATLFVAAVVALGLRAETTDDDGFLQVRAWAEANLPPDAKIGVTNSTAEMAFADDERFGPWASLPTLHGHGANYVLTQSLPTSLGYGYARPELLSWLTAHARPVYSASGPTNGTTTVWWIDDSALDAGATSGVAAPALYPEQ